MAQGGAPLRFEGVTAVTMDDERRVLEDATVVVRAGKIAFVGAIADAPPVEAGEDVIAPKPGAVLIPGLIQSHIHLCQTLFRNHADDLALLEWLRQRIWPFEGAHDAASLRASADLGIAELLRSGTTAILDMATVNHTTAVFEAVEASGIRATVGKCHMDVDAGQPAPLTESTDRSMAEALELAERWHGAAGGRIRYAFAPRFALSCTEELFRRIAGEARDRGVRIHTHASENRDECRIVREQTGRDNVDYFRELGLLGDDCVLAHCIHLGDHEVRALADHDTRVAHCPSSNLKLGSGICRVPELRAEGISVSVGADGAPCNNNLDALVEMRLAALVQKPRLGPQAMPARSVLEMATIEGAKALGLEGRIGQLREGFEADLTLLQLDDVSTEPGGSPYSRIVYAAQSRHVRTVVVAGRVLLRDGELTTLDAARVTARAREERANTASRLDVLSR